MDKRFESISLFEFQKKFSTKTKCLEYLAKIKWKDGNFRCRKCGHKNSCNGKAELSKQCCSCNYVESPTAQTLFHKVKFDLVKAFYIVYFVSTNKKGITSTELSRKLNLRQKTCWSFKRKVMEAMKSSEKNTVLTSFEVDETFIGGQESNTKGRGKHKKKLVVVGIEKKKKGVSRVYAEVIEKADYKSLGKFIMKHTSEDTKVVTDKWLGYKPLEKYYKNFETKPSGKKGINFPEMHRVIMMLKSWLRGIHHHVNHLQAYLDEYCFRFNRSNMNKQIFNILIEKMVFSKPCYIKNFIA